MKRVIILIFSLLIAFAQQSALSQLVQSPEDAAARQRQRDEEQRQERNRLNGYNDKGFMTELGPPVPLSLYKGRKKESKNLKKTYERTKHLLVVPEVYTEKYKFLLKDKKVKLARLQPDKNCYGKNVVSVESLESCLDVVPIPGDGSLYSFKSGFNFVSGIDAEYQFVLNDKSDWWSIHFLNGKFIVQNNSVRGIISDVGDVDLSNIDLASRELEFLNDFKQKKTLDEVKEQSEDLKNGIGFNNFVYSNSAAVRLNSTYVLRSIDYRSIREKRFKIKRARTDKRADMIIVLKVVGQENDGSVIILWKELKAGFLSE